jgi:hypothetical protein
LTCQKSKSRALWRHEYHGDAEDGSTEDIAGQRRYSLVVSQVRCPTMSLVIITYTIPRLKRLKKILKIWGDQGVRNTREVDELDHSIPTNHSWVCLAGVRWSITSKTCSIEGKNLSYSTYSFL